MAVDSIEDSIGAGGEDGAEAPEWEGDSDVPDFIKEG